MPRFRPFLLPAAALLTAGAAGPLAAQTNINVPAGSSLTINESGSYQNVTVGTGASLETIDANSGGGGDHAITITLAAGGAGTIQNDGVIEFAGNDQGNTTVFANSVTLSGSGTLELLNAYGFNNAKIQGPGTVTQAAGHTLIGGGGHTGDTGPSFSAPLVNNGLVTTSYIGFVLNGASLVNNGTFSASNGSVLSLVTPTLDNTGGTITVGDANSLVFIGNGDQVTGGTLQCTVPATFGENYGVFRIGGGSSLANLTIAANAGVNVSDTAALAGTVTNNGYLLVLGGTTLNLAGNVTLAGSGVLYVSGHLEGANNATLTINAGQTLDLSGQANVSGVPDVIDANVVNNGTLAGVYQVGAINSPVFTNNGLLVVDNGAYVGVSSSTNFTNFDPASQTLTGGTYTLTDQGNEATLNFGGRNVLVNAATVSLSGANTLFGAITGMTNNTGTLTLLALNQFTDSASPHQRGHHQPGRGHHAPRQRRFCGHGGLDPRRHGWGHSEPRRAERGHPAGRRRGVPGRQPRGDARPRHADCRHGHDRHRLRRLHRRCLRQRGQRRARRHHRRQRHVPGQLWSGERLCARQLDPERLRDDGDEHHPLVLHGRGGVGQRCLLPGLQERQLLWLLLVPERPALHLPLRPGLRIRVRRRRRPGRRVSLRLQEQRLLLHVAHASPSPTCTTSA